jgi:hypothetical protein
MPAYQVDRASNCSWQAFANRHLVLGTRAKTVFLRVGLEQALVTPPITAIFFMSLALLEGFGISDAIERVKKVG